MRSEKIKQNVWFSVYCQCQMKIFVCFVVLTFSLSIMKVGYWSWQRGKSWEMLEGQAAPATHQVSWTGKLQVSLICFDAFGVRTVESIVSMKSCTLLMLFSVCVVGWNSERKRSIWSNCRRWKACIPTKWGFCWCSGRLQMDICSEHIEEFICGAKAKRFISALEFPSRCCYHGCWKIDRP